MAFYHLQYIMKLTGQSGFLSYEQEDGEKLSFHMSELEGEEILYVGDEVEFVVVINHRIKKHSACNVNRVQSVSFPG